MQESASENSREEKRAVIVSVPSRKILERQVASSHRELESLLGFLGVTVDGVIVQRREKPHPLSFVGKGQLEAMAEQMKTVTHLVVDDELTSNQRRHLGNTFEVEVWDRTEVILRTFAQRAKTPLSRAEVERAQIAFELPRLRDNIDLTDGGEGGGGRGGRGASNIDLRKQNLRARDATLRRQIEELTSNQRTRANKRRAKSVAVVGYTNAGKSTLVRALTDSDVLVADRLFATVSTTSRKLLDFTPETVVLDTVGFVQRLPHDLVPSFRATLMECLDADVLLVVYDASDVNLDIHRRTVNETLVAIGAGEQERVIVLNKCDKLTPEELSAVAATFDDAMTISALSDDAPAIIKERLKVVLDGPKEVAKIFIPFRDGDLLHRARQSMNIVHEDVDDRGYVLDVTASKSDIQFIAEEVKRRSHAS